MKKLKKLLTLSALGMVLTSSLNAEIQIGVGTAEIGTASGMNYSIGYGATHTFNNGVYAGFLANLNYLDSDEIENDDNSMSLTAEGRLGYTIQDLSLYGILGYAIYDSLMGMGYGGGVTYQITNTIGLGAEYKTFSLEDVIDYDIITANLSFKF